MLCFELQGQGQGPTAVWVQVLAQFVNEIT